MKTSKAKPCRRAFTLVELMIGASLSAIIMAGVLSSMIAFTKSSLRLADYSNMESQTTRALEILARELRMSQSLLTDVPADTDYNARFHLNSPPEVRMQSITLTVPDSTNTSSSTVVYSFSGSSFLRTTGGVTRTLITDIQSGTGKFLPYNKAGILCANELETQQILVSMTISPNTSGNYVSASKRVISARFVLRNKGI
jgi:prepilin-type N-terminal cleavage/methylation domain-containing protein